jgi:hypothetical protein
MYLDPLASTVFSLWKKGVDFHFSKLESPLLKIALLQGSGEEVKIASRQTYGQTDEG